MNRLSALARFLFVCCVAGLAVLPAAYAQPAFSIQGRLTTPDGAPVPDGAYEITLALFDRETGGTPLWTANQLALTQMGVFAIYVLIPGLSGDVSTAGWAELTVEGESLAPRTPLTAVPYALNTLRVDSTAIAAGPNISLERQDDGSLLISAASGSGDGELTRVVSDETLTGNGVPPDTLRLADGAVTGAKIADGAIVGDENVLVSRQNDGSVMLSVEGRAIGDALVHVEADNSMIGDGRPETPLGLADGGVKGKHIDGGTFVAGENVSITRQPDSTIVIDIELVKLDLHGESPIGGDGSLENPLRLDDGGITSEKLADEAVTAAKIDGGALRGGGTVEVNHRVDVIEIQSLLNATRPVSGDGTQENPLSLDDGGITDEKIAAGAVTAIKLDDRVIEAGDGIQVTRTNSGSFKIAVARSAFPRVSQLPGGESLGGGLVAGWEQQVYNGNVVLDARGEAVVVLPDGFAAHTDEVRYQLTCIGGFAPVYVAEEITANRFTIAGGAPGLKVSWQVTRAPQNP